MTGARLLVAGPAAPAALVASTGLAAGRTPRDASTRSRALAATSGYRRASTDDTESPMASLLRRLAPLLIPIIIRKFQNRKGGGNGQAGSGSGRRR